jgi:hypothetical protein
MDFLFILIVVVLAIVVIAMVKRHHDKRVAADLYMNNYTPNTAPNTAYNTPNPADLVNPANPIEGNGEDYDYNGNDGNNSGIMDF